MEHNEKAGKRVRRSMVDILNDAISGLRSVLTWAEYEDAIDDETEDQDMQDTEEKATSFEREITRGDIERSRSQLTRPSGGGGGRTPNWSARVGEIIIGNLMRGEGGRFASARNIAKMMNALDDAGITPDMFTGMQALLAGESGKVAGDVLADLRSAGLVNDAGLVQAKANEIINAIKTGDPNNLKKVLKPSASGGGGGGGGGASKPSKEETEAANIAKLKSEIVARGGLTEQMIDALLAFSSGEEVPEDMVESLLQTGLVALNATGDMFLTAYGISFIAKMKSGDLRGALDAIRKGVDWNAEGPEGSKLTPAQIKKNVEDTSKAIIDSGGMTQSQLDALLAFDSGETPGDEELGDLIDTGLLNVDQDGNFFMTPKGQQMVRYMERGLKRDALDVLSRAKAEFRRLLSGTAYKTRRNANLAEIVQSGALSREQANAIVRVWLQADLDNVSDALYAELLDLGLVNENKQMSAYGKLFMRTLETGNATMAEGVLGDAGGGTKMYMGLKSIGNGMFLTWTSNAFEDRDGEIFTTESLEKYLNEAEKATSETYGDYDFWHIEGSEFADIKWQGGVGRFIVEIGEYKDNEVGRAFKAFFDKYPNGHEIIAPHGWGCSHKFLYVPTDREDGVYEWLDKQKSTVLPLDEAANPFTLAEFGLGEKSMRLSDKQTASLRAIGESIGMPDLLEKVVEVGEARTAILEDNGMRFKAKGVCKTEDGVCYPASDYAYVEDPQTPTTWKLRMSEGKPGNVTAAQLGRAAAAFSSGGFRGNKVELPGGAAGAAKRKIRAQYRKLGVKPEEIPESVKMIKDEIMNKNQIAVALKELAQEVPEGDVRVQVGQMAEDMVAPESDAMAIQRMLMEIVTELPEEVRTQAEELIVALGQLAEPPVEEEVPVEEPVTEEEMPVEIGEEAVDEVMVESNGEEEEVKEDFDVDAVVEKMVDALHLKELSTLIEDHDTGMKGLTGAVTELVEKLKGITERLDTVEKAVAQSKQIEQRVEEVAGEVAGVKEQTESLVDEKAHRFTPYWGAMGVTRASIARETELTDEQKELRKPQVPSVIAGMRDRMMGR